MTRLTTLIAALAMLAGGISGAQAAADGKQTAKPERVRPIPQTGFTLRVQTKPRFPGENPGEMSKPASEKGLSITIQPEKKEFAANGPLSLKVVLRNTTERAITLPAASSLGGSPKLVLGNQKTAAQWTITGKKLAGKPATLKPGQSKTFHVVVESRIVIFRPVPQPVPRAGAAKPAVQVDKRIAPPPAGQPGAIIGRPIRPVPPVVNPYLPVGQGPIRARLFVEFSRPRTAEQKQAGYWTGKLVSDPVDFQIGKPDFVPFPMRRGRPEKGRDE